jgi:hypothetical protein
MLSLAGDPPSPRAREHAQGTTITAYFAVITEVLTWQVEMNTMSKQRKFERQVERVLAKHLSHVNEKVGMSNALVVNSFKQRKFERQVERRLAMYLNHTDEALKRYSLPVLKVATVRFIDLNLEDRRRQAKEWAQALLPTRSVST